MSSDAFEVAITIGDQKPSLITEAVTSWITRSTSKNSQLAEIFTKIGIDPQRSSDFVRSSRSQGERVLILSLPRNAFKLALQEEGLPCASDDDISKKLPFAYSADYFELQQNSVEGTPPINQKTKPGPVVVEPNGRRHIQGSVINTTGEEIAVGGDEEAIFKLIEEGGVTDEMRVFLGLEQ